MWKITCRKIVQTVILIFISVWTTAPATVVSNFHGTDTRKVSRRLRDGTKKEFDCPMAVNEYNMYMGRKNWSGWFLLSALSKDVAGNHQSGSTRYFGGY